MSGNAINVFDVQRILKHHESHGFDLSHPRGVVVHGKLYPTINKQLLHMFGDDGEGVIASAEIPLESGNLIKLQHVKKVPSSGGRGSDQINALLYTPMTSIDKETGAATHSYSSWYEGTLLNKDNAHEVISSLMNVPSKGYIGHTGDIGDDYQPMKGPDYVAHARAFNDAEQLHNTNVPRVDSYVNIGADQILEHNLPLYRGKLNVPKGHIHIESIGVGPRGETMVHPQNYAYDPENETLKRAEVE